MITSFTTLPIHYPLIILPFDEEWSDLLTASLNKTHMNTGKDNKMPVHTIHTYWEANILFHAIAWVLDGRECQVHAPAAFTPNGKGPQYVLKRYLGGTRANPGSLETSNHLFPTGN
jgi:hypothetical protein